MTEYPETPPSNLTRIDRFLFNARAGRETRLSIERELSALESSVDEIVRSATITNNDTELPILVPILQVTHDAAELVTIGEALLRAAPLLTQRERLLQRKAVLDLAETDPGFFLASFGDLSHEFTDFPTEFGVETLDAAPPIPRDVPFREL